MKTPSFMSVVVAIAMHAHAQETTERPPEVVPSVDLVRYSGTWYEIARFPNRFQRECVGDVTATYTLLDDGTISVVNRCRKQDGNVEEAEGKARRKSEDAPTSKLLVRFAPPLLSFLPFVWADYWIIELAPDYSYAVIGEPDRKYLWILARSPKMGQERYDEVIGRLRRQGYDVSRLVRTNQGNQIQANPTRDN